jgi:hypothetical protein
MNTDSLGTVYIISPTVILPLPVNAAAVAVPVILVVLLTVGIAVAITITTVILLRRKLPFNHKPENAADGRILHTDNMDNGVAEILSPVGNNEASTAITDQKYNYY